MTRIFFHPPAAALLAAAVLAALLAATPAPAIPEIPDDAGAQLVVPRPDLNAMEETARGRIESMQSSLEDFLRRDDVQPKELAEGFGHLGQLFHAYRLLDSAESCYRSSLRLSPGDYRWSYYLGLVRNAQGDLAAAAADYQLALAGQPDKAPILVRLGDVLVELNRIDEARQHYTRAIELEPENAAAYFGLAKVTGFTGDTQGAIEHFLRVLELQPEASVIHYLLGQAYRQLGDLDKAREHLAQHGQEDVKLSDPLGDQISRLAMGTAFEIVMSFAKSADEYPDAEFLGFVLSHLGDVRGSIEQLQQGLARKQEADASPLERSRIHYVLGGLLVNDGRDEEAIEQFTLALELAPDLHDARVKLGNALARGDRLEDAIVAYGEVLKRQPDNAAVPLKRVAALMELGRDAEARADLERLLELDPAAGEVHVRLATILERSGDATAAIERYRAAAELDLSSQERSRVHYRLASLLRQRGDLEAAVEQYAQALEAEPELIPALGGLAGLLAQSGRMREAASHYATLVALEPDQLAPRMAEATALILSHQHAAARSRLEAALERFPDDLRVVQLLARHLAAAPDRTVRNGGRAVELTLVLFDQVPSAENAETLAMAYAEVGNFEQALKWQRQLIAELVTDSDPALAARLERNLARYERGETCCAGPGG